METIARAGMTLSRDIEDYPEGIIIPIDKPYRWTSADVIRKVKWAAGKHFGKKNLKVGHAGTLDPLASGVLLVCIGKATKLAETLQRHDKEYIAGINFGATTPSYDREKEIDRFFPRDGVSKERLQEVLPSFLGEQEQVAPLFSAKSVDGVRAYEMARRALKEAQKGGGDFDHSGAELLSRQNINITRLELVSWQEEGNRTELDATLPESFAGQSNPECSVGQSSQECLAGPANPKNLAGRANPKINVIETAGLGLPKAEIIVGCTKGTYIRALARDLGEALGSGAFLDSLRRTRTGGFRVEDALSIDEAIALLG